MTVANAQDAVESTYWVDLLDAQVRIIEGRFRTRIVEAGQGPTLLLLHGTGGHAENYARNIAPLARHFHVVALDFLWHGKSQVEGYDPEIIPLLVEQVIDVLDVLGVERAHIEGQSLGGWVAMQTALRYPARVDRLVLTTTMGYTPDAGAVPGYVEPDWSSNLKSSLEVLREPTFDNVRTRMARILANPARLTDEAISVRQALYAQPALAEVQARFISEYLAGDTIKRHLVTDALAARIAQPTLVYWGDKNRTPPALGEHIAHTVQHGEFHCAADTGHWAQFESADEHNRVVTAFLQSVAQH
jgi:2-hydroxy-6-oxonona-2,4-dienedioate hydrolase